MPGVFEIHPAGGSTIICDTLDTIDTAEYLLISADLKESEREKIIYSEGKFDGSVINSTASIVTVEFVILVNGDTPEEIAGNLGTLKAVFFNHEGGYIEYRPIGYSSSVITTFYKYLQSPPPERLREPDAVQSSIELDFAMGQLYRFQIKVFSLATSDPDDVLGEIISGDVWAYTEGSEKGYLVLSASSIKGDGLFPIISIEGYTSPVLAQTDDFIISFYEIESGKEDLDWYISGPTMDPGVTFDTTNRFTSSSPLSFWKVTFPVQSTSRRPFGKCAPMVSYKTTAAGWRARIVNGQTDPVSPLTDWRDMDNVTGQWDIIIFDTVPVPPSPYPDVMPLANLTQYIGFEVDNTITPSYVNVYGLLLSPVSGNSWIAQFNSPFIGVAADYVGTDRGVSINCPAGINHEFTGNPLTGDFLHSWYKKGMPIREAIMSKGTYQIRYLGPVGTTRWSHDQGDSDNKMDMTVAGQFYTIYPFKES